jgi:hypothetical protein
MKAFGLKASGLQVMSVIAQSYCTTTTVPTGTRL